MNIPRTALLPLALSFAISACNSGPSESEKSKAQAATPADSVQTAANPVNLPAPYSTESVNNYCTVIGWPAGTMPTAPAGFTVSRFADSLQNPRWIYVANNGDIFVCETNGKNDIIKGVQAIEKGAAKSANKDDNSSANRITLFRDSNNDGIPESRSTFLTGLYHPLGMAIIGNTFYVANNDAVMAFPYREGQTSITDKGRKILELPSGKGHWTRNILPSRDGKKLFVAIGSGSNIGDNGMDKEVRRADILQINPDGSGETVYGYGIRNPVGMGFAPETNTLWTAVNERDGLGDDLVPDYLTSVQPGGFYGWPYSYWGQHEDPRLKDKQQPDLVKKAIVPDISMGAHTASLGLAFDEHHAMPGRYSGGAFVGQHGSWNRSRPSGYAVVFVPFKGGKPAGAMEPFLTGFVADSANMKVHGRPVGVAFAKNGDMLVADDVSNIVWRVSAAKK